MVTQKTAVLSLAIVRGLPRRGEILEAVWEHVSSELIYLPDRAKAAGGSEEVTQ
jgi:hypothetical protein